MPPPANTNSVSIESASILKIQQGASAQLGAYNIGCAGIKPSAGNTGAQAQLVISPRDLPRVARNDYGVNVSVGRGELIPVGGHLYRVADVQDEESGGKTSSSGGNPGGRQRWVLIEKTPVILNGVSLQTNSFVIPVGSTGELHAREIEVVGIKNKAGNAGAAQAQLSIWPNDYEKQMAQGKGQIENLEVAPNAMLKLGDKQHRIVSVVAPDEAQGLRGYVEIESRPLEH
jgi:hypothetical protein